MSPKADSNSPLLISSDTTTSKTISPKVKLVNFDIHGRGEVARLCLHAGGIPFEDSRISFPEWKQGDLKSITPFGQMPLLYWETPQGSIEQLAQSGAIVRFIAKNAGLGGKTDLEFAQADMIFEHTQDLLAKLIPSRLMAEDAERVAAGPKLLEYAEDWLQKAENILARRGTGWYAGESLTFADLAMEVLIFFLQAKEEKAFCGMDNAEERANILQKFPLVRENNERVRNISKVAKWRESRPSFSGF